MATQFTRFDVLNPVEGKDGKTRWTRIGVVFQNSSGTFSGDLNQYPANGRVVLRVATKRPETKTETESE